ncbi:hypothetical protein Bca52824_007407 [Brassica carinata]|uniref:Uncharacterized protein n=1 Tax=Brassica carinata TaxID=52824 RepID=A0A8X7W7V7_BRACI|nr:hypothetical protein Bca52824_007407 [Brassica carinata]
MVLGGAAGELRSSVAGGEGETGPVPVKRIKGWITVVVVRWWWKTGMSGGRRESGGRGRDGGAVVVLVVRTVTVNVSLWDEAASAFRGLLRAGDKSQSVMLVTSVNPKLFGAQVYSCVDTLEGIKKKELVSIRDLNNFISNSNEQKFPFPKVLRFGQTKKLIYSARPVLFQTVERSICPAVLKS